MKWVILVLTVVFLPHDALGLTPCSEHYGKGGEDWVYRVVDGRKCWFAANGMRRGREKPLEELYWPKKQEEVVPMDITDPMKFPWEMNYRWIDPNGWSHQE